MGQATFDSSNFIRSPAVRLPYRLVQPLVERAIGWRRVRDVYEVAHAAGAGDVDSFVEAALDELGVSWSISEGDKAALAVDGPLVVVANHPFGGIDALSLFALMAALREGEWCCLANRFLAGIPELAPHCLLVDPRGQASANRRSMATALRQLKGGGALFLFPAARVSAWSDELGAVCDLPWGDHALRLAAAAGARLAVIHIDGQNSERFLKIPPEQILRRTFALVRELAEPPVEHVALKLAAVLDPREVARLLGGRDPGAKLRAVCYGGAERRAADVRPAPAPAAEAPIAVSIAGIGGVTPFLEEAGFELLRFRGDEEPELLEALGRAREITFRAAGQGTGKEIDVSPEDAHYQHVVVRDTASGDLVGAYRLGFTEQILAEHGPSGLYLDHIFKIDPALYEKMGSALELSRSFVMPAYQKDGRALALLWRGVGRTATAFGCRNLFGSVTISDAFQPASRAALVAHLAAEHADSPALCGLVKARVPFVPETRYHPLVNAAWRGEPVNALWPVVGGIERGARTPPPLVKYYISLGAKFLAFHVEADFGNAVYCLLRVDIEAMPKRYRQRFF